MKDMIDIAERYLAIWNEPDADVRRRMLGELWAEDAVQILEPPQEARAAAERLDMSGSFESRGHGELERRVTSAHEEFIAPGGYDFIGPKDLARLQNVVKFRWEMVPKGGGEVAGAGLEILILGNDGRIRLDYQFIER
jgi:hypothetical protein